MSYTEVFGGTTIYPSDVSLLRLVLNTDVQLEWPLEASGDDTPVARIIEAAPTVAGHKIIMPDATAAAPGQTILFDNHSVSASFQVVDFFGGVIMTVPPGTQWQTYLADNPTPAGAWFSFQFGASTASVQPSALAGYGLTVTGTTLSVAVPVISLSTTGTAVGQSNRATAFVWTGTGSGTLGLLSAASAGNNFIFHVRNQSNGGDFTIDPSGVELINGGATLVLRPGDSASIFTDGVKWYTIGLGQNPVFAFDYTSIDASITRAPDPAGTYTLVGSELNRISYKFTGALVRDTTVVVPSGVQQYWIHNATTGGFHFNVKTNAPGSVPVTMSDNQKGIFYSDGTNLILASDPVNIAVPVAIIAGGTGATSADAALLNLGVTPFILPFLKTTTAGPARNIIGAAALGANADITSMTALTTITTALLTVNGALTVTGAITGASLATGESGNVAVGHLGRVTFVSDTPGGASSLIYNSNGDISLFIGTTRLFVRSDGFVGIGNTTPAQMLHVSGNIQALGVFGTSLGITGDGTVTGTFGAGAVNSNGAVTARPAGVGGAALNIGGGANTGYLALLDGAGTRKGYIGFMPVAGGGSLSYQNENGGTHSFGQLISAQAGISVTGDVGLSGLLTTGDIHTNVMTCSGNAIFNGTTSLATANVVTLNVSGGTTVGNITSTGSLQVNGNINANGNITAFSDRKLKENLQPITEAMSKVARLTGYTFDRVDKPEDGRQTGLIAQDVQAVLPEAVGTTPDGTLTLAYGNMAGLLVEAIKELQGQIDGLRREVQYLRTGGL